MQVEFRPGTAERESLSTLLLPTDDLLLSDVKVESPQVFRGMHLGDQRPNEYFRLQNVIAEQAQWHLTGKSDPP